MKHRSLHPIILTALLLSLFGGSLTFTPAHAASIVVNTNADTVADDGFCSLREAIANANNDSTLYATAGECNSGSGADVITFAASLSGSTITLGSNLNINEDLTITGPGASSLILDGNHTTQIFIINNLETVTISGMTIMNGNSIYNDGGAIYNYGYLTVQNVTFKDNSATASDYSSGGAIFCDGSIGATLTVSISVFDGNQATWRGGAIDGCAALTITDSEFTNNTVTGPSIDTDPNHPAGGAISNSYTLNITGSQFNNNTVTKGISSISWGGAIYNAGTASISNSTLFGNSADLGGGMYNSDSSPTLTNVTLSNNSANYGGGMYNRDGSPTLTNVTFSGNSASTSGGGMFNNDSSPTLSQTVIANSTGGDCVITRGTVTAFFTLIEDTGANACGLTTGVNGNIIGSDPNLGPLANNGGFTQTHALLTGSPAIDVVHPDSGCEATDQRGVIRPQGTHCDLGAYEYGASILTVTNTTPASGATLQSLTSILVTFNETALSDGSADAANNTANYILVEDGVNNIFDTVNCLDGVASDDVQQAISSVSYSDPTATLHLASPLSPGNYRLFICGTTSIWSAAGLELNNGDSDTTVDFTVGSIASSLPDTGFAPNRVTSLPAQSTHYANLGSIWLEIPSLGVKSEIVGVPQSSQGWNVDWLGNSTGWLHGTAFPSWEGNSVITAHVYDSNGLPGPFNNIKKLNHGDQVIVHLAGEKYIFEVRDSSMVFPSTTKSALEHLEGHSYLTLITCQWYNPVTDSYAFRRVVRAVLVSVQPE